MILPPILSLEEQLQSMARRVTTRRDQILAGVSSPANVNHVNRFANRILRDLVTPSNCGGETLRCWLDQFTVGYGLDVCCGNFKVGVDSIGIDPATDVIGPSLHLKAEDLQGIGDSSCDYVVSNYLDGLLNLLPALVEWHRVLKPGGVLAVVCTNAEMYAVDSPILRLHRRSLYTAHTLEQYITRVFGSTTIIKHSSFLLGKTNKPEVKG